MTPAYTCVHTHLTDVVAGWAEGNHSLTPVRRTPSRASVPYSPPWWIVVRLPSHSVKTHVFFFFPPSLSSSSPVSSSTILVRLVVSCLSGMSSTSCRSSFTHQTQHSNFVGTLIRLLLVVNLESPVGVTNIWTQLWTYAGLEDPRLSESW